MTHTVFGIRHHGPGSARSLERALEQLEPDTILIEGPPEADALLALAADEDMDPPVALLTYVPDEPGRAHFYPFARFSPEWRAIRYGLQHEVPVRFCDLPAANKMASSGERGPRSRYRADPLAALAGIAGHGDPERWWEDVVESQDESPFEAVTEAMAVLREAYPDEDPREEQREAFMRQQIRAASKSGAENVAVVCGAWHAPALTEPGPAAPDQRTLKGLRQGQGRDHLGAVDLRPARPRERLRRRRRLARLVRPALRGRRAAGRPLARPRRAAAARRGARRVRGPGRRRGAARGRARGDPQPAAGRPRRAARRHPRRPLPRQRRSRSQLVRAELVVGHRLGEVPERTPMVPLQQDVSRLQRRLRLKPEAQSKSITLDLRKPNDRERSRLLHRLNLLGVHWAEQRRTSGLGTFKEAFELEWHPGLALDLIHAGRWGTTVEAAAAAKARAEAAEQESLAALAQLADAVLLADLPDALADVMRALADQAALDRDTTDLMRAVPPLAGILRYGDVRGSDTQRRRRASCAASSCAARSACPGAGVGLDEETGKALAELVDGVNSALALLEDADLTRAWRDVAAPRRRRRPPPGLARRPRHPPAPRRRRVPGHRRRHLARALSPGEDPERGASWIEGFIGTSGLVLDPRPGAPDHPRRLDRLRRRRRLHQRPPAPAPRLLRPPGRRAPPPRRAPPRT